MTGYILIGAGGHAKVVADAIASEGKTITHYVDPNPAPWLDALGAMHITESDLSRIIEGAELVLGLGGITPESLARRTALMAKYEEMGASFPPIIDESATLGSDIAVEDGAHILAGTIINAGARIGAGAIINTAAVIEHDAIIETGAHIAPRAVVLGAASIGAHAFVGAGAVVVQGRSVAKNAFVKALTVHK
jgi:sugar O-acyltransferase (sialic acid O-acetyltransferase NeuD family)